MSATLINDNQYAIIPPFISGPNCHPSGNLVVFNFGVGAIWHDARFENGVSLYG